MIEVHTQAIALGISIREQAALEHLVRREADSGNHVGRGEGGLLHLCEVVFWIPIELHHAHFDQWVISLVPDFRHIKRIVRVCLGLFRCHDLDEERPTRKISTFNGLEEIAAVALPISGHQRRRRFVREIFNTLLGAEVELHPRAFVLGIDHREGVTSEAMHMPEGLWNSAVGHHDCDLMKCLWKKCPEVPVILRAPKTSAGVALDRVVEVSKTERIAEKKDWRIVSNDIPIAVLGVELERSPADITLRIGCPALPSDGRKAREQRRLFSNLRKNRRFGVLGDVVSRRERSIRPPALGMHPALRNDLAIKVCELLDEPDVLEESRATTTGCQDVGVVRYRSTGGIGKAFGC